jgi:xanthine dehydrogenase molybdopterin-binding subunit B
VDVGQVQGGFIMGLGYFTSEQIKYDTNGLLLTDGTWVSELAVSLTRELLCLFILHEHTLPSRRR